MNLSTRLMGNNFRVCGVNSIEPRAEVYCVRLHFHIPKLVFWPCQSWQHRITIKEDKLILTTEKKNAEVLVQGLITFTLTSFRALQ